MAGLFGRKPNLYSIPADRSFVDSLALGIRDELGAAPEALVRATVLLPTRRACRSLAEAFLRLSSGDTMLLPRLLPLGDIDEDDLAFGDPDGAALGEGAATSAIAPAITGLRRQMLLTRLILVDQPWGPTTDQAAALALELGRLLDQVQTQRLGFDLLAGLVPDEKNYSEHWQITLDFLKIVTERWPEILAEEGCTDRAQRRNLLIEAQAAAWQKSPPEHPIFAAGTTGSIPATADLLAVIAALPQGAVVLPGLDLATDAETWAGLGPTHPQWGLARLLDHLGATRSAVEAWPAASDKEPSARVALLERALRPAEATGVWRDAAALLPAAIDGLTRIECPGPQEEAGAIALMMRGALETAGRTAALVTPDRGLARRVAAEMLRWGVEVDDSAGTPLDQTPPGAFLRLTARMVAEDLAPVPLLAGLKHPLAGLGRSPGACRAQVRRLEQLALRGPRPDAGLDGLERVVTAAKTAKDLLPFLTALRQSLSPFMALMASEAASLSDLLRAHVAAAEALAASDTLCGPERLWAGEAGEAAAAFVEELDDAGDALGSLPGRLYPALLDGLMAARVVRPRYGAHPRLFIWGLLEARLQRADVMILGGLNEGSWPPEAAISPWMSRPMMADFGLPQPERRIGLTAHDFVQAASAPDVILTRASRVEGTPTVPSRWVRRIETMLRGTPLEKSFAPNQKWLHWQKELDRPARTIEIGPPAPTPPVSARPRRLSVTRIEDWMRNPYGIYARYILGLRALEPIDADPGAADYGSVIHHALDRFLKETSSGLPTDALDKLLAIGRETFGGILERPGARAFWWPRFERIAQWFIDQERERRSLLTTSHSEIKGEITIDAPGGAFKLYGIADRIDTFKDGRLVLIDYKTGAPPSNTEIAAGYAPQLPLEGAMVAAGGFPGIKAQVPDLLEFWRLTGRDPAGEQRPVKGDVKASVADALQGVTELIAVFDFPETPYSAHPNPEKAPKYDDYEHLARVREWATTDGEGDA